MAGIVAVVSSVYGIGRVSISSRMSYVESLSPSINIASSRLACEHRSKICEGAANPPLGKTSAINFTCLAQTQTKLTTDGFTTLP